MHYELIFASDQDRIVINNLMQFYMYDFSEYLGFDVEEDGLFKEYPNLGDFWTETGDKVAYIVKKGEKYVGFVLVKTMDSQRNHFSIAEFFIMKKYRREGIGKAVAQELFSLYEGQWEVHQRENNKPAQKFWRKIIDEYTKGQFSERFENGRMIQNFKS